MSLVVDLEAAVTDLSVQMGSQLRLQLVDELLTGQAGLTLDEAAVRTACPVADVEACLLPLEKLGVVERAEAGLRWRLRADLPEPLKRVLTAAVRRGAGRLEQHRHLRHELLRGLIGTDPKMQLVTEMVRKVARLEVPVLITGETGTGKELIARAIHELSGRAARWFGAVNCGTLSASLFESQVFGHARGAFTGAVRATAGLIEKADGGTLFLDEIGDLALDNQVKLLRVLQNRTFTRVGETAARTSNFRLISATHRDLPTLAGAGAFREDLFYRINVFPIRMPALRERLDDLPHLVDEFCQRGQGPGPDVRRGAVITPAALEVLRRHAWPGNIRELENVVTRALISAGQRPIDAGDLELEPLGRAAARPASPRPMLDDLGTVERRHIAQVLEAVKGNMTEAAAVLGISRATIYRKARAYGLTVITQRIVR